MTVLRRGEQWRRLDRPEGQAARRRIRQRLARGFAMCDVCDTERPQTELRVCKADPDGAVLLSEDLTLGAEVRLVCTDCTAALQQASV